MVLASDYPFLGVLWSMIVFFVWIAWFVMLFQIIGDVFRRDDVSGWNKTAWLIFLILVPFIGVFTYLIVNGREMAQREAERNAARNRYIASEVMSTAPTAEIERAKGLLDSGAITQAEYDGDQGEGPRLIQKGATHGRDRTRRLPDRRVPGQQVPRRDRPGAR